jgi:LmbE family N-acetylglucosaminyl deacetylase
LLLSLSKIHQMVMSLVLGKSGCEFVRERLATAILLGLLLASTAVRPAAQSNANNAADHGPADHNADHKPDRYYDPLPQETGDAGLKLMLRRLQTTSRLMQTVAHPDDEDGGMLTLEARGQGVSTLLMTLNRGEGGQNKLGSNLFDALGVLRTLELLASDRYYGVEQRFSRVADFGFSKTPEETFQKWQGHDIALGDMVRVVRTFRPDVLVARFSGTERDGHGHHQASAILTREAFRAAADPNRFPDQIAEGLKPWQPKKLYIGNVCGFGAMTCDAANYTLRLNTGVVDPVLGTSYIQFAMQGLRHQESQGAANWTVEPGDRFTFYKLVDSLVDSPKDKDGHEQSFFDGIDTTLPGLASRLGDDEKKVLWLRAELESIAAELRQAADKSESDSDSVAEPLSKAVRSLDSVTARLSESGVGNGAKEDVLAILREKRDQAQAAVNLALSVSLRASVASLADPGKTVPKFKDALTVVSPTQKFQVIARLHNGSRYWLIVSDARMNENEPGDWVKQTDASEMTIGPGQTYYANFALQVPADAPRTGPYWHRDNPETEALNTVDVEKYQTLPLPPPPLRVSLRYETVEKNGGRSPVPDVLQRRGSAKAVPAGEISATVLVPFVDDEGKADKTSLAVAPVFSVNLEPNEQVLPVENEKEITVKVGVSSNLTGAPDGNLRLTLPNGWKSEPRELPVSLAKRGDKQDFLFRVFPASLQEGRTEVRAVLEAGGRTYGDGYTLVTREDLGAAYYYQPATQHVSVVDVKVPKNLKVGYVMGAGDEIPTVLKQIGMDVTLIPAEKLGSEDLSQYQTIVLGIRAYDTQKDVIANNKRLLDFVQVGGRLVVQYNTLGSATGDFNAGKFTPYPATLGRARVSVEEAPVAILDPANPIFHSPNEITQKDFEGWVQERGLYFMTQWDSNFTPLLESHDPGEAEQKGGLLIAHYGKGAYIYTGYAFFRQLPAGVPGAVRLFVNLVAGR